MIRKVGLVLNRRSAEAVRCAERAAGLLREKGIGTFDLRADENGSGPDLILSFGGDGTLLAAARYAMDYDAPLLGINLGTVGFLTEAEPAKLEEAVGNVIAGRYEIEIRSLLEVSNPKTGEVFNAFNDAVISRGGYARLIRVSVNEETEGVLALNDAVVTRAGFARLIQVETRVNGQEYGFFTADGIIVATPTGSTGYSLSAGGPIVEPSMNCMVITPICAHSMQHCPCVVSGSSRIVLRLDTRREQTAELQIDGKSRGMLNAGDEITVSGTEKQIRLIRLHPYDFFGLIHRKLSEWGS